MQGTAFTLMPLSCTPIAANPTLRRARLWSRSHRELRLRICGAFLLLSFTVVLSGARERWSELNIGPFYVDFQGQADAGRDVLNQLEQVRWVLGGLLESKDLPSVWPIRVVLSKDAKTNPDGFVFANGRYLLASAPGQSIPLGQVAGILLDANTPRLPPDAESGLRQLFGTLQAKGSKVVWGGPVPRPDLAWARMQLFATKFEYGLSFHIFVAALRDGSGIRVAERNAFGKEPDVLEKEAAANLAQGHWEAAGVSGRPLDPKRDFGQHVVEGTAVEAYLADGKLKSDPNAAVEAYKAAIEAGGDGIALGYEGLAALATIGGRDPSAALEDAMRAGSTSAPVYLAAAKGKPDDEAMPLLKKAAQLNPRWAEPVYQQAQSTEDPAAKEQLLKQAVQLDPRGTKYWVDLAQVQTTDGHAVAAQGSWLRAEDSAATDSEREKIHAARLGSEQQRLNAAEAERERERNAVHLENQRAEDAETARIRAAEEKANQRLSAAAEGSKPETVVPWEDTVPKRKLEGRLTRVECLKHSARITVNDKGGRSLILLLAQPEPANLACGSQQPAPRVTVIYAVEKDDQAHTDGRVLTLLMQ